MDYLRGRRSHLYYGIAFTRMPNKIPSEDGGSPFLFDCIFKYMMSEDEIYPELRIMSMKFIHDSNIDSINFFQDTLRDNYNNRVLKSVNCDALTINKIPACSITISHADDEDRGRTIIISFYTAIDDQGKEISAFYSAPAEMHEVYLPLIEHMIKSLKTNLNSVDKNGNEDSSSSTSSNPFV